MKNSRGVIQPALVVTLSAVTLAIVAAVIIVYVRGELAQRNADKQSAKEIAEFGMDMALREIDHDPAWTQGIASTSHEGGFYTVEVEKLSDSTYRATAVGHVNKVQEKMVCVYKLELVGDSVKPHRLSFE